MKMILTTLNSKFIHSNLAIRYLKAYIKDIIDVSIREFTINQSLDFIISELYKEEADIIAFSTYIWNLRETLSICESLKMIRPNLKIILGGPEVSFDGCQILKDKPYIDFIIEGEGEDTMRELVETFKKESLDYKDIRGIVYRQGEKVVKNPSRPLIRNLDKIPSPYKEVGDDLENKIVYYESSRGCPFNCKFCLSSTIKGVRFFNIDRVKEDLAGLIEAKVRQVKFVDRTFNANKRYAMEIMNFIIDKDPDNINFHFEVTAHLLDDEMISFLKDIKEGLFQFEIGVQSTNEKTIDAIGRDTDFEKLKLVTKEIKTYKNIHQHLDLIAGLPYEDYHSFSRSFNDVYNIRPEKIQLGFLKLLKGSDLRKEEEKYGYKYLDLPPYEVLESNHLNYGQVIELKAIEDLVEKYYNDGYFKHSLEYIIKNHYSTPFNFYEDFSSYWEGRGYHKTSHSKLKLYKILLEFYKERFYKDNIVFNQILKYDFIVNNKNSKIIRGLERDKEKFIQVNIHKILKNQKLLENKLRDYKDLPTKMLIKNINIEFFLVDVIKIIEGGYEDKKGGEESFILFNYKDGVINKCETYNISQEVREVV